MKRAAILLTVAALLLLVGAVLAADGYDLSWRVIGGGGGHSSSADYALDGTAGQAVAETASGGSYTLAVGFWPGHRRRDPHAHSDELTTANGDTDEHSHSEPNGHAHSNTNGLGHTATEPDLPTPRLEELPVRHDRINKTKPPAQLMQVAFCSHQDADYSSSSSSTTR